MATEISLVGQSEGDRALVVTQRKGAFYCFASRTGGDVIALVAHINDMGCLLDGAAWHD